MNIKESISLAFASIIEHKLRAFLTLLSISIGVFAIFGSGTLTTSINSTVNNKINELGENTFLITRTPKVQTGRMNWRRYRNRPRIRYNQVDQLKKEITTTNFVSAYADDDNLIVKSPYIASDPNVKVCGVDENYFFNYNTLVEEGRQITESDIMFKRPVCVIGVDIMKKLFPGNPIGEKLRIQNQEFEIIGILEEKGAIIGNSLDNRVLIPLPIYLKYYTSWWESLQITVKAYDQTSLIATLDETIGIMRSIRGVKPWEDNNFEIELNEGVTQQFSGLTQYLSLFGFLIGIFSLVAAGIGIMNIMLITIKERTREIGVRKAVGSKPRWILQQFLIETVTLSQLGGLIGIVLTLIVAYVFSEAFNFDLVIPFNWIVYTVLITTFLGIASGLYPAWKAAKLDPIEALRYE